MQKSSLVQVPHTSSWFQRTLLCWSKKKRTLLCVYIWGIHQHFLPNFSSTFPLSVSICDRALLDIRSPPFVVDPLTHSSSMGLMMTHRRLGDWLPFLTSLGQCSLVIIDQCSEKLEIPAKMGRECCNFLWSGILIVMTEMVGSQGSEYGRSEGEVNVSL